jgi:hypothetical protein
MGTYLLRYLGVRRHVAAFKARTRHTRAPALVRAIQRSIALNHILKVSILNTGLIIKEWVV